MRSRYDDHVLDVMHAEGRALISRPSRSLGHELSAGRVLCPGEAAWPAKRAAQGAEMTALSHNAFGITVDDAEGAACR
jgi:hypothetical protein